MSSSVRIYAQETVVHVSLRLDHAIEITGLEGTAEYDLLFEVEGRVHALESSIEVSVPIMIIASESFL